MDETTSGSAPQPEARAAREVVRETIIGLLGREGHGLVADPRRVEAFLRDLCGEHPAEISVAVSALREGIADQLESQGSSGSQPASLLLPRLASRLHGDLGVDEALARWAVGTWALALGVADEDLVRTMAQPSTAGRGSAPDSTRSAAASGEHQEETLSAEAWAAQAPPVGPESATQDEGAARADNTGAGQRAPSWLGTRRRRFLAASLAIATIAIAASAAAIVSGGPRPGSSGLASPVSSNASKLAFRVPPLGTYRYATTVAGPSSGAGASPSESVSTAEALRVGNQIGVAWTGFGASLVQSDLYDFTSSRVIQTSTELLHATGAPVSTACIWSPAIVKYQQPLVPGRTWSSSSVCSSSASGVPLSIQFQAHATVAHREHVDVPLGRFTAVIVDVTQTTTTISGGSAPSIDHATLAFAVDPMTGIPISEASDDQTSGQKMVAKLEGFTPLSSSG